MIPPIHKTPQCKFWKRQPDVKKPYNNKERKDENSVHDSDNVITPTTTGRGANVDMEV